MFESFSVFRNGRVINVPSMDDICFALKARYETQELQNERLREENEKLKSEHYSEDALAEMKQKLDSMTSGYRRGFPISEDELKAIDEWRVAHDAEAHNAKTAEERCKLSGVSGGRFKYVFTPTGLGIVGVVQCSCGSEFCFRNLE